MERRKIPGDYAFKDLQESPDHVVFTSNRSVSRGLAAFNWLDNVDEGFSSGRRSVVEWDHYVAPTEPSRRFDPESVCNMVCNAEPYTPTGSEKFDYFPALTFSGRSGQYKPASVSFETLVGRATGNFETKVTLDDHNIDQEIPPISLDLVLRRNFVVVHTPELAFYGSRHDELPDHPFSRGAKREMRLLQSDFEDAMSNAKVIM